MKLCFRWSLLDIFTSGNNSLCVYDCMFDEVANKPIRILYYLISTKGYRSSCYSCVFTFSDSHHDAVRSDQSECFGHVAVPVRTQHVPHILPPAEEHPTKVNEINELLKGHRQNEQRSVSFLECLVSYKHTKSKNKSLK